MSFPAVRSRLPLLILATVLALEACDKSRPAYALTSGNTLIKFETNTPKSIESEVALSGLASGESLLQIDIRPADKTMYGLVKTGTTDSSGNTVYFVATVNPDTGTVSKIGTTGFVPTAGSTLRPPVTMDINPVGDYLRIIDYAGSASATNVNNFRAFFDGSTKPQSDSTTLAFNVNDTNSGENPELVAIAHSNSVGGASSTTLYGLELTTQSLVRITTSGQLYTIGSIGHGFIASSGFDIVPDGDQAFAAINTSGENAHLYKLDLSNGSTSDVDQIGGGYQITSLAVTLEDKNKNN